MKAKKIEFQDRELKNKKTKVIKREEVPNTPFEYMTDGEKHVITLGGVAIAEPENTKEEAMKATETPTWETITNVILIILNKMKEYEEYQKSPEKEN